MKPKVALPLVALLLGSFACRQAAVTPKQIPITTTSADARAAYLKGFTLAQNLRLSEAHTQFDEAVRLDPGFTMAHVMLARTAGNPKEYFEHLKTAVAAAGKASEGEQLIVRGMEAGSSGNTKERGEILKKLVAAYPDDELAHTAMGEHYYTAQDYDAAIAEYQKINQLAPNHAPAYNMLGYALRAVEREKEAEAAFRKYIELIPNEPNPYDSLGELLLKMGRYDDSIESYKKALAVDPKFAVAHRGIALNLMYQDKHKEALDEFQKMHDLAATDGEREQAISAQAVCLADQGKVSEALDKLAQAAASAEKRGDKVAMSRDIFFRAQLLLLAGKADAAKAESEKSLELARQAAVPDQVKKNIELGHHGTLALIAAAKKDLDTAAKEAEIMRAGFASAGNPGQMRAVHEVLGRVALARKNYDDAITELNQANRQSGYVLFLLAQAYAGKKDTANAATYYRKAANANPLPDLSYAMIRKQAKAAAK